MVRRLLVLLLAVSCATAPPKQQAALFEMHSDFWLNMHHFVRAVGRGMPAEGELTPVEREAWMAAVEYYKAHYLERDLLEDEMVAIKEALRIANNNADLSGAAIDPQLREILERAEPVYRAHWWPQHDAANRAWIAAAEPRVARYGPQIADAIAKANEETWFATPVPLDLSVTAGPNGAYTTLGPPAN